MIEANVLNVYCDAVLSMMPTAYGVLELLSLLRGPDDAEVSRCLLPAWLRASIIIIAISVLVYVGSFYPRNHGCGVKG